MNWLRNVLALLVAGMLATEPASAAPPHIQRELGHAHLKGEGTYRWLGLRLYQASLWTRSGTDLPEHMTVPFALDLRYARALPGKRIAEASIEQMMRLGFGSPHAHVQWLDNMIRLFPDVQEGTHLTGVYFPGAGVRFYHDGNLRGEVADPAFAQAFFAIWLHERTSAPGLRTALLEREAR